MSDRLEDTSLRLKDEMDLYKRMMDKLRHNRLEFQKEREATQEVGQSKSSLMGLLGSMSQCLPNLENPYGAPLSAKHGPGC